MKIKFITIIALLIPSLSYGFCCTYHHSKIDGVAISYLGSIDDNVDLPDDNVLHYDLGASSGAVNTSRNKAFLTRCAKGKNFYIAEYGNMPFVCKTKFPKVEDLTDQTKHSSFTLTSASKSKLTALIKPSAAHSEIHTISFKPLNSYPINFTKLKEKELSFYAKLANANLRKPKKEVGSANFKYLPKHVYANYDKTLKQFPQKLSLNDNEVIFLPMYYTYSDGGSDLVSAVFIKHNSKVKYAGEMPGCITRLGADVDNDGFPEVITTLCESIEGGSDEYMKVYPKVKSLIYLGVW